MIVVTGAAGFIGSNLVAALEARGESEIVACDRLGSDESWRNLAKRELAAVVAPNKLFGFLKRQGSEVTAVFHMGAVSSTTVNDADHTLDNNLRFPLRLWDWCAENQVRLVYASSAATYGDGSQGFDDDGSVDGLAALRPLNLYGWSKHLFDRRVARLVAENRPAPPQWVGLKFFNVYGPNEYHKGDMQSLVSKTHQRLATGRPAFLFRSHHPDYADGGQLRDFVSVDDCVEVCMWLLDQPKVNGLYNLGTGEARSFLDLAQAVFMALGREPEIEWGDTPENIRDKYQYFTEARMDRLRAAGYERAFRTLEEGVADYVKEFLERPDPYR